MFEKIPKSTSNIVNERIRCYKCNSFPSKVTAKYCVQCGSLLLSPSGKSHNISDKISLTNSEEFRAPKRIINKCQSIILDHNEISSNKLIRINQGYVKKELKMPSIRDRLNFFQSISSNTKTNYISRSSSYIYSMSTSSSISNNVNSTHLSPSFTKTEIEKEESKNPISESENCVSKSIDNGSFYNGIFNCLCSSEKSISLNSLKKLVNSSYFDINKRSSINGLTLLSIFVRDNNFPCTEFIINLKADINIKDTGENTPLIISTIKSYPQIISLLLKSQADVNISNNNGRTALHYACNNMRISCMNIINELCNAKANMDATDINGLTPLLYSLKFSQSYNVLDVVRYISEKNPNLLKCMDHNGFHPLNFAVLHQNKEVIKYLIKCECDINCSTKSGYTPLMLAFNHREINNAKVLLENRANIEGCETLLNTPHLSSGYSMLMEAANSENISMLKFLLTLHQVEIDKLGQVDGLSPLIIAIKRNSIKMVSLLIDAKASLNKKCFNFKRTPLIYASQHSGIDLVKFLITSKCNIHEKDIYGKTALHYSKKREIRNILLDKYLLVSIPNWDKVPFEITGIIECYLYGSSDGIIASRDFYSFNITESYPSKYRPIFGGILC